MPKQSKSQQLIAELEATIVALKAELTDHIDGFVRDNYIELVQKPVSGPATSGVIMWTWVGPTSVPYVTFSLDDGDPQPAQSSILWGPFNIGRHKLVMMANGRTEAFYEWEITA